MFPNRKENAHMLKKFILLICILLPLVLLPGTSALAYSDYVRSTDSGIVTIDGQKYIEVVRQVQAVVGSTTYVRTDWREFLKRAYPTWTIVSNPIRYHGEYIVLLQKVSLVALRAPLGLLLVPPVLFDPCNSAQVSYQMKLSAGCKFYN
jgi:hypothetical protein